MTSKLSDETKTNLKRDFEADWAAYRRQQLEAREAELEHEYQEALKGFLRTLEGFDQWWPNINDDNIEVSQIVEPSTQEASPDQHKGEPSSTDGTSSNRVHAPTIRQMMLSVLPELRDREFMSADVKAGILQEWPEAETNAKHLSSRISQILKQMVDNGQLEVVRRGEHVQDPIVYRAKENEMEQLLNT